MTSPYAYQPLGAVGMIRLLQLHPRGETDDVHFSLIHVSFDQNPTYEALSYCWGDADDARIVYCDGKQLRIPATLFVALQYFRPAEQTRTLWADALCINQEDIVERSQQVLLMPAIYSQANRVLIWLGEDMSGLDGVAECINTALEFLPSETHDAQELREASESFLVDAATRKRDGKPNHLTHNWQPLTHLVKRPWFERKWVIQEAILGKDVTMTCGNLEIPWKALGALAFQICSLGIVDASPGKSLHNAAMIYTIQHYIDRVTVLDMVLATTNFHCTEPRDHVYGILALHKSQSLEPDYSSTIEDVFKQFAILCMVELRSLKILSVAPMVLLEARPQAPPLSLPSWVPDLTRQGDYSPLISYSIREQQFFAGGKEEPSVWVSDDESLLHCKGRIVDTVKMLAKYILDVPGAEVENSQKTAEEQAAHNGHRQYLNWLNFARDVAAGGVGCVLEPEKKSAFARTVMCDLSGMRDPVPEGAITAFSDYMDFISDSVNEVNPARGRDAVLKYGTLIEQSISGFGWARRFCSTAGDTFGQVPRGAEVGDRICVLVGAEVAFVIRPTGKGTYSLIGECYLHGFMKGEGLAAGTASTEDIILE